MAESLRILILEDNPADAELVQFELEEAGIVFSSRVVMTEDDFISELQEFSPDLILSDYDLPKYNGALALAEVRRRRPDTPFILVTGAVTEDRAIDILTQGAKDYVLKTRLEQRLVPAVRRALAEVEEHKERKKAEEELRTASLYSRTLIEASLDPLVTISSDGKVMDVNKATEEFTGLSRERIIGNDFSDYFTEPEKARAGYKKVFSHGSVKDYPLAIRHINGHITDVLYNATVYKNEKGEVQGVFAAARDVTELTKAEAELRGAHRTLEEKVKIRTAELESEIKGHEQSEVIVKRQARLLDLSRDAIFAWNLYGAIEYWNQGAEKLYGYSRHEAVGRASQELLNTRYPVTLNEVKEALERDGVWLGEIFQVAKDGRTVTVETILQLIKDALGRQTVLETNHDITERKKMEDTLRVSEERFSKAFNNSPNAITITRVSDGKIIEGNDSVYELLGYDHDEVIGKTTFDLGIWADADERVKLMQGLATKGFIKNQEFILLRKDRTPVIVDLSASLINIDNQQCLLTSFIDITERKKTEEALKESERKYRELVKYAPVGIYEIDFQSRKFVTVNESMILLSGYTSEELLAMDPLNILADESKKAFLARLSKMLKAEILDEKAEYKVIAKNGRVIDAVLNINFKVDEQGIPIGATVIGYDITERKQAEEVLRKNQALLQAVMDGTTDPVYVKDCESRILLANGALARAMGKPLEEIIDRTDTEYYGNSTVGKMLREHDLSVMASGSCETVEEMVPTASGNRVFISNKAPFRDASGKIIGIIGISRDITERKEAEEALKKRTQQLEDANKELESFSYSVSHDLRAPLRAIDGFSRKLEREYGDKGDEKFARIVSIIRNNTKLMGNLIDDLLSFSKVQKISIQSAVIDMDQLISEVCDDIIASNRRQELEFSKIKILPGHGDRVLIRQVFFNLLSNAAKFTRNRKPGVIEINSYVEGEKTVYCIKDNGVGFDMAYYDKLFGVFQSLHSHEEYEGTGIGLAIVQHIVKRHGGDVWAEGKVDHGATFYFSLPSVLQN